MFWGNHCNWAVDMGGRKILHSECFIKALMGNYELKAEVC